MKQLKQALLRTLSFAGALCFAMAAALPAFAATAPSKDVAVVDDAGILSKQTETYITNISIALQDTCGAQIGVYTTEYIGNSTMEGYAYNVFGQWELGSATADNGVLLLLANGEDDYFLMRGEGLERDLSISVVNTILDSEMEPSWLTGDYDAGTQKTVRAIAERLCSIYGITMDIDAVGSGQTTVGGSTTAKKSGGIGLGAIVLIVLAVVLVVWIIKTISKNNRGRRGPGAPPPPPPTPMGGYGGYTAPRRYRGSNYTGSFLSGMMGGMVSGALSGNNRRRSTRRHTPSGGPGGFSPPRSSGSRPSGLGRSSAPRSSGGGFRSGGGSFRAGGGSTRGGGVGRRR